jgi:hypothetical protein
MAKRGQSVIALVFSCFLQRLECRALPAKALFSEPVGNIATEALERRFADEELGRLLVATDLAKRDGAWAVTVGFPLRSGKRELDEILVLAPTAIIRERRLTTLPEAVCGVPNT